MLGQARKRALGPILAAVGCSAAIIAAIPVTAAAATVPSALLTGVLNIAPGQHGPAVTLLQDLLDDYGAGLQIDGVYGPATQNAVTILGHALLPKGSLLYQEVGLGFSPAAPALLPGQTSAQVAALQRALNRGGIAIPVTGTFDATTEGAVREFETKYGLPTSDTISLWQVELALFLAGVPGDSNPATPTVSSSTPTPTPATTSTSTTTTVSSAMATRLAVTNLTIHLLGSRYVWGGVGPKVFDCSGLVMYVYREAAGMALPHDSRLQFDMGRPVTVAQLEPGDLVFFNTDGPGPSHVGIYIGNYQFISATNPQQGVVWGSLANSYWESHFIGARSLLPEARS